MNSENDYEECLKKISDLSSFDLVKKLCEKFSQTQYGIDTKLNNKLIHTAWSRLLHKTERLTDFTQFFDESGDVFVTAISLLNEKKNAGRQVDFNLIFILEELSKNGLQWVEDTLKFIVILSQVGFNKQSNCSEPKNSFKEAVKVWIENARKQFLEPKTIESCRPKIFKIKPFQQEDVDHQPHRLKGLLKESKTWPVEESNVSLSDRSNFDIYDQDEGFVTPSDESQRTTRHYVIDERRENYVESFGRTLLKIPDICQPMGKWDLLSGNKPKEPPYFGFHTDRASPGYIPREKLLRHLKALLLGISSESFVKTDGKFHVKKDLCTDGMSYKVLFDTCHPFLKTGEEFLTLDKFCTDLPNNPCTIMRSAKPMLDAYRYKYQAIIRRFPECQGIIMFRTYIQPLAKQIRYLVNCFINSSSGVGLLEQLYDCLTYHIDSPTFHLLANLFFSCCQVYFVLLDRWIFFGETHPDFFVAQTSSLNKIVDRASWNNAFRFIPEKAPHFLPSLDIFNCGKNVALLHLCSKDASYLKERIVKCKNRPQIMLHTSPDSLKNLRMDCLIFYNEISSLNAPCLLKLVESDKDLAEIAMKHAEIANDLFKKKQYKEREEKEFKKMVLLKSQKDDIEQKLKYSLKNLMEERSNEIKIQQQASLLEKAYQDRQDAFKKDLLEHYDKITVINDTRNKHLDWKIRRLYLNSTRQDFLINNRQTEINSNEYKPITAQENKEATGEEIKEKYAENEKSLHQEEKFALENEEKSKSYDKIEESEKNTEHDEFVCNNCPDQEIKSNEENDESSFEDKTSKDKKLVCSNETSAQENNSSENKEDSSSEEVTSENSAPENVELETSSDRESSNFPNIAENERKLLQVDSMNYNTHRLKQNIKAYLDETPETKYEGDLDNFNVKDNIRKSVSIPLEMQQKLINAALYNVLIVENNLLFHITAIRKYFFLTDGMYSKALTNLLFDAVLHKEPVELLTFVSLRSILSKASLDNVRELSFEISETPAAFESTNPKVLSCLNLGYKAKWPLNLILTDIAITKYNSVFSFVTSIERASWHLERLFRLLRIKYVDIKNDTQYKQIQLHRHVMFQFIYAMKSYLSIAVFETCWKSFSEQLTHEDGINGIYNAHVSYLKEVRFKCFLNKSSEKIMDQIMKLLHFILVYCQVFEYSEFEVSSTGEFTHVKFAKLRHTFSNFMSVANYFSSLMQHLAQNKQHTHFDTLLLFLHSNSFNSATQF